MLFQATAAGLRTEASSKLRPLHSISFWFAVKELKLRDYPPIMENQVEKNMENEMETGGNIGI